MRPVKALHGDQRDLGQLRVQVKHTLESTCQVTGHDPNRFPEGWSGGAGPRYSTVLIYGMEGKFLALVSSKLHLKPRLIV
jgi:hypothetical protein